MRIVLRHNTMNNSALSSHWSTDHNINSLWWEIYNNVFTWNTAVAPSVPYFARLQGGGTGLFYNNTVNGFGANNIIVLGEARTVAEGQSGPPINFCDGTNAWDGNAGDTNAPGWPCIVQTGRNADKTVASIIAGSKESSFPMYFWNNGPQDKCYNSAAVGAACDNSVVPSIRDPNWFKATAHTVTGGGYGQGDVDYSVTASQPSGAGTHTLTYTPYVYPHPLNIPDVVVAQAQPQQTPDTLWGSIYNTIVPTYADRQTPVWQGNVNGRLRMQGLTVGPAQFLLQAPGAGNILQTNGVAKICLAGTC